MPKKDTHKANGIWGLAAISFVVFLGSLTLVLQNGMFISPDETANAFFAKAFQETSSLAVFVPINEMLGDMLIPRSIVSKGGALLPGSFIGLPILYGFIGKLFSAESMLLFTPIIAVAAVFAWYGIMKRFFKDRLALLAAGVLAIHPAWWYYTARTMMHNVLFASLLIFSAFFVIAKPFKTNLNAVLSGLCLGLALFVRTSEVIWIGLAVSVAIIMIARQSKKHLHLPILLFVISVIAALLPMLFLNSATYGGPFITGYTIDQGSDIVEVGQIAAPVLTLNAEAPDLWNRFQEFIAPIFPFGVHPRNALRHGAWYGLGLFWWMSLLALIGLPLAFFERKKKSYVALFGFVTLWLGILYGSWVLHDNPDPSAITIGNSYIRYWLPAFILSTPFIALGIEWIVARARTPLAKHLALATLVLALFGLSLNAVFFASDDSLVPVRQTLERSKAIQKEVLAVVPENGVIIVDRADKLFFPHRLVRQPLRDESTYQLMPEIVEHAPLYYYGITFPERDMRFLNDVKLPSLGLKIEHLKTFDEESLYSIHP